MFRLYDLVEICLLPISPTRDFVTVAGKFKLLAGLFKFDNGDIREQFDAHWLVY